VTAPAAQPAADLSAPFLTAFPAPGPLGPARLPIGRHGLPRELIRAHQRNRLLAGAVAELGERGCLATSIATVIKAAGVSRSTFYEHFADKEACFLTAYDEVLAWLEREGSAAVDRAASWPAKVRAAVDFTLGALAADPNLGRLVSAEIFLAGPAAAARHRQLVDRLCEPLRAGRAESPVASRLPANLEPTLIGGAVSLVARHIAAGDGERLAELAPEITYFLLLPYLGAAAAQSVAAPGGRSLSPALAD
jgi:AcrR family transcriptional regulator